MGWVGASIRGATTATTAPIAIELADSPIAGITLSSAPSFGERHECNESKVLSEVNECSGIEMDCSRGAASVKVGGDGLLKQPGRPTLWVPTFHSFG